MRILFVSGVDVGGAPASTLELARRLSARGHHVGVLLGAERQKGLTYPALYKAAIKIREATGSARPRELLRRFGGSGGSPIDDEGVLMWRRPNAANALRPLMNSFVPDVVVANSHPREHLRWIVADTKDAGTPIVLYMREEHSTTHLSMSGLPFDRVVANSRHLTEQAEAAGYRCLYVPSIVDLRSAEVESSRRAITLVNPVPENRPEILRELAQRRPDIPVVLQESWPLDRAWIGELTSWADGLPNLTVRAHQGHPGDIYRDARFIVATYPSGRPRVVLEAQHNGIPVVALAQPALIEAVGAGGILIPPETDNDGWVMEIARTWDDVEGYGALCERARQHSRREEIDHDTITRSFEDVLAEVTR